MYAGIIPLKDPRRAKQRLAGRFSDAQRVAIAEALTTDALDLAASFTEVEWWVVSDSEEVRARVSPFANPVEDDGTDLNSALSRALVQVVERAAEGVLIVPGDLPLATVEDLHDLLDTAMSSDVVVVPSGEDGGTNGLGLTPPDVFSPHFGPASLQAHIAAAESSGHRCTVLALDRMALDLDTPEDADKIVARGTDGGRATVALLNELLGG